MKAADRQHLGRLASIGCIVCHRIGTPGTPAEIHHLRSGAGAGQRSSHQRAIPLCHIHHRTGGYGVALHAGQKAFEESYGGEEELLSAALELIA